MTTLADIEDIAEAIHLRLKADKKTTENVRKNVKMLIESHGFLDKAQPAQPFWDALQTDEFYEKKNMPSTWTRESSYDYGLKSICKIMCDPVVKETLETAWTNDGYNKALEQCEARRKQFLKNYKKTNDIEKAKRNEINIDNMSDTISINTEEDTPQQIVKECLISRHESVEGDNSVGLEQEYANLKQDYLELKHAYEGLKDKEHVWHERVKDQVAYVNKHLDRTMVQTNIELIMFGLETLKLEINRI